MSNRSSETVKRWATAFLVASGLASGLANATLMVEPDGVLLDTVTGLEWEQGPFSPVASWAAAVTHAAGVTTDGGGFHLATIDELQGLYNDLIAAGVCTGANCTGSIGGFTGIAPEYWSSTEFVPGNQALVFDFTIGFNNFSSELNRGIAWAVRPNDVDVAAVAEPASLLLFGLSALGLGWARRRKSCAHPYNSQNPASAGFLFLACCGRRGFKARTHRQSSPELIAKAVYPRR